MPLPLTLLRLYQIPEITKPYDTFYILATEYVVTSMEEGAPDYAPIGCPEMMEKAPGEYEAHASRTPITSWCCQVPAASIR